MKFTARLLSITGVGCALMLAHPLGANAQPDEAAPKAKNPPAQDVQKAALDKAKADGLEAVEKIAQMTPLQIRDYMQEIQEKTVRTVLVQNEFNDLELQEIVIEYLREQNLARTPVRLLAARVRDAIADKELPDATLRQLLAQWQQSSEQEQLRSENAVLALRDTLQLDERPRLDAVMHLYGIIGNEAGTAANILGAMSALALLPTTQEIKALPAK